MTFTTDAWERTAGIRAAIDALPFLTELESGALDRATFAEYMTQDALYLGDYARVLAGLATRATDPAHTLFFAGSARDAIAVERELHAAHVDVDAAVHEAAGTAAMSPTTRAYTSYLLGLLAGPYEVAVAGVLPCYWIYQDVGARLLDRVGAAVHDVARHPYGDWIAQYGDEEFAASVEQAKAIADGCAQAAPHLRAAMDLAYDTASRYEWMFWDAAHRRETWPV